jgi:hypothetical protein
VSNSHANLEIIGSNDEQQLCNANKMDLNQSFVFLVDFFIKKSHLSEILQKKI